MLRVREALLARHGDVHEWLTYTEAWRIDVFAMRAREGGIGYRRIAYEIKVSRADFLADVRKPVKRRLALEVAHQFFYAVPRGLVRPDEVPVECGLVAVLPSGKTKTAKVAPVSEPRPFTQREVVYLARMPMYRERIEELRNEVSGLRWALGRR